ncbi:MAG TPA: DUF1707 domain-containing protein [Acidimicrobiales bacterium]|nr:DUF1707 domain-containing protein [Acidimicrobiales bacterium]
MAEGPLASDTERERVVAALQRHFSDGRLTAQEFSERLEQVLEARTLRELYDLTSDLPELPVVEAPIADSRSSARRRFWRRG